VLVTIERYSFRLSGGVGEDSDNRRPGVPVNDVGPIACRLIGQELVECVVVFFLDDDGSVFGFTEVARASVDSAPCRPIDVLRPALLAGAAAVVVCHNHPSGDAAPSLPDRAATWRLRDACEMMRLTLIDHLVVAGGIWRSVLEGSRNVEKRLP
jgi:DNA repair protein RadC